LTVGVRIVCNYREFLIIIAHRIRVRHRRKGGFKITISPDLVFTRYRHDLHQDHRFIAELAWNTFRDHLVLEYEIPKYDGDLGAPNLFVPLDASLCHRKMDTVLTAFKTQQGKRWFSEEIFRIQICSTAVLAHLPSPEDFALQGMVVAMTGFLGLFKDAGLSVASVQREVLTHEQISTLFWINVANRARFRPHHTLGGSSALNAI
jgi:hypothetical protein